MNAAHAFFHVWHAQRRIAQLGAYIQHGAKRFPDGSGSVDDPTESALSGGMRTSSCHGCCSELPASGCWNCHNHGRSKPRCSRHHSKERSNCPGCSGNAAVALMMQPLTTRGGCCNPCETISRQPGQQIH
jgi:hypothetical protein